jgi:signal transduction histidine kinase
LHGGTVTLDSVVGQGTKVECSFPIEQRVEPQRSAA